MNACAIKTVRPLGTNQATGYPGERQLNLQEVQFGAYSTKFKGI